MKYIGMSVLAIAIFIFYWADPLSRVKVNPLQQNQKGESAEPDREKDRAFFLNELGGVSVENYCVLLTLKENMRDCVRVYSELIRIPGALEKSMNEAIEHSFDSYDLSSEEKIRSYIRERKSGAGV